MKTYCLKFKPCGPITQIPDSQAFFGSLCFAVKSVFGKEVLENILINYNNNDFQFIVSSFFLENTLPFPLDINPELLITNKYTFDDEINNFKKIKSLKNVNLISFGIYYDYIENIERFNKNYYDNIINGNYLYLSDLNLLIKKEEINIYPNKKNFEDTLRIRNKVNINEDTNLFYNNIIYLDNNTLFDAYIKIKNNDIHDKIIQSIKKIEYLSIGGKRSVGINLYKYVDIKEKNFITDENKKLLLSKAVINPDVDKVDFDNSYYKVVNLNNKFDNYREKIYKKGALYFTEGSVLYTKSNIVGQVIIEKTQAYNVYHNAIGFLI